MHCTRFRMFSMHVNNKALSHSFPCFVLSYQDAVCWENAAKVLKFCLIFRHSRMTPGCSGENQARCFTALQELYVGALFDLYQILLRLNSWPGPSFKVSPEIHLSKRTKSSALSLRTISFFSLLVPSVKSDTSLLSGLEKWHS